jgi:hypothetical protein
MKNGIAAIPGVTAVITAAVDNTVRNLTFFLIKVTLLFCDGWWLLGYAAYYSGGGVRIPVWVAGRTGRL